MIRPFSIQLSRRGLLFAGLIAVVGMSFVASASATQPLSTLRAQEEAEKKLRSEAAFTSKTCGTSIRSSIDWSSTRNWPENANIVKACDGALSALEAVCRADKSKGSKISSFVCKGDSSGPSLSGSKLIFGASPDGQGFSQTKSFLDGAL